MKADGIILALPKKNGEFVSTASGTKFLLPTGEAIPGVTSFSMPEHAKDDVLTVTITVALNKVVYQD